MTVEYIDDGKRALFNDLVFVRDDKTGYYLNSTTHTRLHRAVYEYCNGSIPDGYHVHHVDHNRMNNEPENLIALSADDHRKLHGAEMSDERREQLRINMVLNVSPSAAEWHHSEAGRQWHAEHYERMKDALHVRVLCVCENCGKEFQGIPNTSRFCSNACKSAWRRKAGIDDVERICPLCGQPFITNKYSGAQVCSRSCANRWRKICKYYSDSQTSA